MTLRYVFDQPEIVANCAAMLIPAVRGRGFGKCSAIGVIDEEGKLIAGIVYNNWNPDAGIIEMHAASIHPRWLTRETMKQMYQYPFHQLGVQMIVQQTPVEDERLLRQLAAGNYTFIHVPRMFGRDKRWRAVPADVRGLGGEQV